MIISISGKGGTGKTTITALVLKTLIENTDKSILLVDADPSTNVPIVLNEKIDKTVGMVASELKEKMEKGDLSYSTSKSLLLEAWVYETIKETMRYDVLPMGRTEGEGCYCYVNSVLTSIIDKIASNYDVVLMDMEAGLEHLSRRTDKDVDIMLIVTDPSKMSLETVRRIKDLTQEVHIGVKEIYVVGNKFPFESKDYLERKIKEMGLKLVGIVPVDLNIINYSMEGKSLLDIPRDSPAYESVRDICLKIGILNEPRN